VSRAQRLAAIRDVLGERTLVWFGIRGDDAAALLPLPQFRESFAVSAPLKAAKLWTDDTLEQLTGRRVDLDTHDIDLDTRPEVGVLRRELLARLNGPSVLTTYRPSHFLSAIHFACRDQVQYLGQFKQRHLAFEHKPWVETRLREEVEGVNVLPWTYVAEEYRETLLGHLDKGPQVLRASYTSGGAGVVLVEKPEDIDEQWLRQPDALVSVAPFLSRAVPVNVGACVFPSGTVTVHPGSLQLIGIPSCTTRRFGYCGNDLAAFGALPPIAIGQMDCMTRLVGRWLARQGYLGAFGVDYLVDVETDDAGTVFFAEINPRFQGSTSLTTSATADAGRVDLMLDHLSAFLGIEPAAGEVAITLTEWQSALPPLAQIIVHNRAEELLRLATPAGLIPPAGASGRVELNPEPGILVDSGAVLYRLVCEEGVTTTGFELHDRYERLVASLSGAFKPKGWVAAG